MYILIIIITFCYLSVSFRIKAQVRSVVMHSITFSLTYTLTSEIASKYNKANL